MTTPLKRIEGYFLNLGFYPGQIELGPGGIMRKRLTWSLIAYALLVLGLLSQQCINLTKKPIRLSLAGIEWPVLAASLIVGIALFPPFMLWFNKKRRQPSWEHVLWAFSFGFFINLSSNFIWKQFLK
jgi:RsiW-degrading membrane proteinase PrsW (M82 family)